jgi:exodeoxyribonuclease VII large subunit
MNTTHDFSLLDDAGAILRVNERRKKYPSLQDENSGLSSPAAYQFLPPQKSEKPYTISQINDGIGRILESGNTLVWLEGEISNFKRATSGHCYLRLKDEISQIPAVLWKQTALDLKFQPEDGMQVLAIASIRVYQKGGYYQLDIHRMQPAGLGALYAAFLALKEKLEKEGLFDPAAKKPLPDTVETLGVITSKQGAALQDIIKVVRTRSPRTSIVLIDVAVQGDKAAPQIAAAIRDMNAYGKVDCIIVGRGGGSIEDLWAFNEEIVARAIAASKIPIISAVGHEIDFTIADFVADVRAPTPSAAAEIAVPDDREGRRYFYSLAGRLYNVFTRFFSDAQASLDACRERPAWQRPLELAAEARQSLDELNERQARALNVFFEKTRARISAAASQLSALSPLATMGRGYSVVADKNGATVKNASQVSCGDAITIYFHTGKADATINATDASAPGASGPEKIS